MAVITLHRPFEGQAPPHGVYFSRVFPNAVSVTMLRQTSRSINADWAASIWFVMQSLLISRPVYETGLVNQRYRIVTATGFIRAPAGLEGASDNTFSNTTKSSTPLASNYIDPFNIFSNISGLATPSSSNYTESNECGFTFEVVTPIVNLPQWSTYHVITKSMLNMAYRVPNRPFWGPFVVYDSTPMARLKMTFTPSMAAGDLALTPEIAIKALLVMGARMYQQRSFLTSRVIVSRAVAAQMVIIGSVKVELDLSGGDSVADNSTDVGSGIGRLPAGAATGATS